MVVLRHHDDVTTIMPDGLRPRNHLDAIALADEHPAD